MLSSAYIQCIETLEKVIEETKQYSCNNNQLVSCSSIGNSLIGMYTQSQELGLLPILSHTVGCELWLSHIQYKSKTRQTCEIRIAAVIIYAMLDYVHSTSSMLASDRSQFVKIHNIERSYFVMLQYQQSKCISSWADGTCILFDHLAM